MPQPGQHMDRSFSWRKQRGQKWTALICTCLPDGPLGEWCSRKHWSNGQGAMNILLQQLLIPGWNKEVGWTGRPWDRILHPLRGGDRQQGAESLDFRGSWSQPTHLFLLRDRSFQKPRGSVVVEPSRGNSLPAFTLQLPPNKKVMGFKLKIALL